MLKLVTPMTWKKNDLQIIMEKLDRVATALEVLAGLRPRAEQGKDESEIMESNDEEFARQEREDFEKGRPEEPD